MAPDQSPSRPRESLEEYVARRLPVKDEEEGNDAPIPEEWQDRPRRRASRQPPNFQAEKAHALEWARVHCGCWKPEVVDVKRLKGGRTSLLIRGQGGSRVALILERGAVEDVRTEQEFRALAEVLRG